MFAKTLCAIAVTASIATVRDAAQSPSPQIQGFGDGLVVTHVGTRGSAAAPVFDFTIQFAGRQEFLRFLITQPTRLERVEIRPGRLVLVWGKDNAGRETVEAIDGNSGKALFRTVCLNVRLVPTQTRYVCTDVDGQRLGIDFRTKRLTKLLGAEAGALAVLKSGSIESRRKFLVAFQQTLELRDSPGVRAALLREFDEQVQQDLVFASRESSQTRVRVGSVRRDYLGDLIRAVGSLRDASALAALSRVDHLNAPSALRSFGEVAIPHILTALRDRPSPGVSIHQRAGLVEALVWIAKRETIGLEQRRRIEGILPMLLDQPDSNRELVQALALVIELDTEAVDARIQRIASSVAAVTALGLPASQAKDIQTAARRVFESRMIVR